MCKNSIKGFRKVEIELDEGDDEDPFGEEIDLDDLPDLEQQPEVAITCFRSL